MNFKYLLLGAILTCASTLSAQKITTYAEDYKQVYQGGGVSYGLYKGHVWSMSEANQDIFFELLFKDIKMKYVQYYAKKNPTDDPDEYDKVSSFMQKALEHNSDLDLIFVLGDMPDDLTVIQNVNGEDKTVLDIADPDIYTKVADWMFVMMNDMYDNGTPIDGFSMANEPDWASSYELGYQDQKIGLALLTQNAVPILKGYLADPLINTNNLAVPKIIAPANISPSGCLNYINNWKSNYPNAWAQVDIVGTHQYTGGGADWNTFSNINKGLEGRGFLQTEQHTNKGDNLGTLPLSDPHRGILSLTNLFSASVNNGVESWWYFVANYPNTYHNGGLMQVAWGGSPVPYKTYYAFKQLNSIQSDASRVMSRTLSGISNLQVISFRKPKEDKIVLHIANVNATSQYVYLDALNGNDIYGITGYKSWVTNETDNIKLLDDVTLGSSFKEVGINLEPYALTSIELTIDESGYTTEGLNQTITFSPLLDKGLGDPDFSLMASSTSGLPVSFEVVSGPATLLGNTVSLTGVGEVTIKASQIGNDTYFAASDVYQSFTVASAYPNIALGKTVTVSSEYNATYVGSNLVDGDKISNSSRWLSANGAGYPQWAEIDLGADYIINSFALWTGYNGYKNPISDFNLEFWNGDIWETVLTVVNNSDPKYLSQLPEIKTNKVRLNLTDGDDATARLYEIELYGYAIDATNVALGKTIVASSSNGSYPAANLIDDDNSTNDSRWLSSSGSLPEWFTIDFGSTHTIKGINFWTGFDGYTDPISGFNLEIWKNGDWEEVFSETDNDQSSYLKIFEEVETDQIRFTIADAPSSIIRMFEFRVYGNSGSLSVNDFNPNKEIQAYPNPLRGNEIRIKGVQKIESVEIYNLLGIKQPSQFENDKIQLGKLAKGVYLLRINNNYSTKFIKN